MAAPRSAASRERIIGIVIGVALSAAVAGLVAVPLIAVHRSDLPFERAYGNAVVGLVSRIGAGSATNPLAGNARAAQSGAPAYAGSCATCHGAKGDGRGVFGDSTYPLATDLTTGEAKEMSDAQLFWITKNGLAFTAMPAFGRQYTDQDLWALVTYLRQLQAGTARSEAIPVPTADQLAMADPFGDAVHRGAATYFAQGCALCHGAVGNAPGELALRGRGETEAIRRGRRGMPAYGTTQLTNAELADLQAYMATFAGAPRGGPRPGGS